MAVTLESHHQDMVHDIQLDYYGTRLATCSSDATIKIFQVAGDQINPLADLHGHQGPVFEVAWGHPKFGGLLVSCGFDNRVIIWQESTANNWVQVYASTMHTASVNSVSIAPYELGLIIASASSDGSIGIISQDAESNFVEEKIEDAHPGGATGVSWGPATAAGSLVSSQGPPQPDKRFASGGCDRSVKVWSFTDKGGWQQEGSSLGQQEGLEGSSTVHHEDWVRDVAWAPSLGLPITTIASASQDGKVIIWNEAARGDWQPLLLHDFKVPVFKLSWSVTGKILAVSDSSNKVTLWKESVDRQWQQINN